MQVDNTILTADNFVTGDAGVLNATHVADLGAPDPLFDDAPAPEPENTTKTEEAVEPPKEDGIPEEAAAEEPEADEKPTPRQSTLSPERVAELEKKYGTDLQDYIDHYLSSRGIDLDVATASLADLQQYRNEQLIQSQLNELRNDWGDDFDTNYAEVQKYFNEKLGGNPAYDTVEGARMIWARIAQERGELVPKKQASRKSPTVTTQTRKTQPGAKTYKFRQSEIMAMPSTEYAKRADEITQAWMEGQVLNDLADRRR